MSKQAEAKRDGVINPVLCQLIGNFTLFENTPLKIKELTQKYFPINQFYDDVYALRTVRQVTIVLKTLQSIYCFCVTCMSPAKCRLWSIAAHRDHFVRQSVCQSGSHTFLVVTRGSHMFLVLMHSYVSQAIPRNAAIIFNKNLSIYLTKLAKDFLKNSCSVLKGTIVRSLYITWLFEEHIHCLLQLW